MENTDKKRKGSSGLHMGPVGKKAENETSVSMKGPSFQIYSL